MCSEPDYFYEVWRVSRHRARKPYRCYECHRTIPAGEVYVNAFGAGGDGDGADVFRTHVACEDLREFVHEVICGGHGEILRGGLSEELTEVGGYLRLDVIDEEAWGEAGLEPPWNPLEDVFNEIKAAYPEWSRT